MNSSQWMAALCSAEGRYYQEIRDALLEDDTALSAFLDQKIDAQSDTSITAIHYQIIAGWKQHGEQFRNFLAKLDGIDYDTERMKVSGLPGLWRKYANIAKREYGDLILPLCWEVFLKYGKEWNSWVMNIFITTVEYIPNRKSIEPLIRYMVSTTDLPQHRFTGARIGYLAASLSVSEIKERLEILEMNHSSIIEGIKEARDVIRDEEKRKE